MRATHLAALAAAIACVSLAPASAAQTHAIDPAKSKAQFRIAHIFVSRVTGTIQILRGEVALDEGATIPSAVSATLESSDYFDTQKFPEWTFASTKITPTGPAAFGLDGTLTIHGVAQPEHLDVTVTGDAKSPQYHATGRIDRHAFGMKGARLDPVIGKDADVTLDIVLSR